MTAPGAAPRRRSARAIRDQIRRLPGGAMAWRVMISIVGGLVIAVGVVLLPLPGPGWLIIFLGLGLWATEFHWAARLLKFARAQFGRWTKWVLSKPRWLQMIIGTLGLAFTAAVSLAAWYLV
jgi:uncharacterized protein (TIGR02611 family)